MALLCITVLSVVATLVAGKENGVVSYHGFKAHLVMPKSEEQIRVLMELSKISGVDFWSSPGIEHEATVMISPDVLPEFLKAVINHHIPYNMTMPDVEEFLNKERQAQERQRVTIANRRKMMKPHLMKYLRYDEMTTILNSWARKCREKCKLVEIGRSFEGRPIYMMRISNNFDARRGVTMIEAGIHAREWAAPALALHAIHEVIENPELLEEQDWHIIPMANPDGYEYTHTTDRLWRKTRSRNSNGCYGADGNRNFNIHWAEIGSSADPCSEVYHGRRAFSEVETRAIRNAVFYHRDRLKTYIALHSFGSYILYPFGHTRELTPDWQNLDTCGKEAAKVIAKNGGSEFTVGNTANTLYPSGAGSDDYMKAKFNVPFAYTVELPGGGFRGFDLPPSHIASMVNEVFPGIIVLSNCWNVINKK